MTSFAAFALSNALNLLKKLLYSSLGESLEHLAGEILRDLSFVAFHGEGLATARLSVRKDGSVIALDAAVDQTTDP